MICRHGSLFQNFYDRQKIYYFFASRHLCRSSIPTTDCYLLTAFEDVLDGNSSKDFHVGLTTLNVFKMFEGLSLNYKYVSGRICHFCGDS